MADATEQNQQNETKGDDLIPRAEAKKAFEARDAAKKELKALMDAGRVLSDEQFEQFRTLQESAAKAEEDRKKKAGEFDSWRNQITEKHAKELESHKQQISQLSDRFKQTVVKAEFGAATDYFGGDSAKTILDVELAMAALGRYVQVDDLEDDPLGYRVVVKNPKGETILGADGNPAPFADAIGELIKQLPNRDRILRGSGKVGSGSSGGSTGVREHLDLRNLTPEQRRDPKVLAQLRAQQPRGALVMGEAYSR